MSEKYLYEVFLFRVKNVIYDEVVFDNYISLSLKDYELYRDKIILNQLKKKINGKEYFYIPIRLLVVLTEEELFYLKLKYGDSVREENIKK